VAFKDLLVYLDQSDSALARLRPAADLASRHASRLTALFVREPSEAQSELHRAAELGLVTAADLDRLDAGTRETIDAMAERLRLAFEALVHEHAFPYEWRPVNGPASSVVHQHARLADLCIVGWRQTSGGAPAENTISEQLLFDTGRPVLFIPTAGSFTTLGRHIVVAWDSSWPAARAVHDALPLIERAERTTVITINPAVMERHGAPPVAQLVEHLRRHNAKVDAFALSDVPAAAIADTLQAEAGVRGADVIVAGAFGHPKLWETLLGGVTRNLLDRMRLPVLMSH
jgi:nucleotide-binding universal stress UspA family protein